MGNYGLLLVMPKVIEEKPVRVLRTLGNFLRRAGRRIANCAESILVSSESAHRIVSGATI